MGDSLATVDIGTGRIVLQVATGGLDICVRLDNGSVKCWGSGDSGRLGYGDTTDRSDGAGVMGDNLLFVHL